MALDFETRCAVSDVTYVLFFTLGLWNVNRIYLNWKVGVRFPYKPLLCICAQLFASLVFVVVPMLLTAFVTPAQAFSWLAFVAVHSFYCWRVYTLEVEAQAAARAAQAEAAAGAEAGVAAAASGSVPPK